MKTDELLKAQNNLAKVFEPYTNVLQSMNANALIGQIPPVLEKYYEQVNQLGISSNVQQLLQTDTAFSRAIKQYNYESLLTAFNQGYINDLRNKLGIQSDLFSSASLINDNFNKTLGDVLNGGRTSKISSYDNLMHGLEHLDDDLIDIVDDVYCDNEEVEESEEKGFSNSKEIYEAMEEQINNPIGFQERIANWTEKMVKQYFIAILIVKFIFTNFLQPYFQDNIGKPVTASVIAYVRELPDTASEIIVDLKENIEAIIIENVPYYFKISFVDENGDTKQGYVSKRSVKFVNHDTEE